MSSSLHSVIYRSSAILQLMRPKLSIQGGLYTLLGAYLVSDKGHGFSTSEILAAIVVALIIAGSFVINDYHDRALDSLSKSDRPIPSGRVTPSTARILGFGLLLLALSLAGLLGVAMAAVALLNVVLSVAYSYVLKSTILLGNITIAALDASILVYGSLSIGWVVPAIWMLCLLAFLHVLAQEILSTIADQRDDASMNLMTTTTGLGAATSLDIFRLVALTFVMCATIAPVTTLLPQRFLIAAIPCSILPTLAVVLLLRNKHVPDKIPIALRVLRYVWMMSLIPVFLVRPFP